MVRLAALLGAFGVVAVVLAACGGGDEDEPTPAGATSPAAAPIGPTAEERAAAEPLLKAAALLAEDLPEGFTFAEERFVTNEQSIAEQLNYSGAPTLEDLNRWGQILEYEVTYSREVPSIPTDATLYLEVTTSLYRDSAGADENFEFVRRQTTDPEYAEAQEQESAEAGQDIRDVEISPISFASVGEDRMAFELRFTTYNSSLGKDLNYVAQLIGVRRGRAIGTLQVLAVGSPHAVEELEDLAHTLDERMKAALE